MLVNLLTVTADTVGTDFLAQLGQYFPFIIALGFMGIIKAKAQKCTLKGWLRLSLFVCLEGCEIVKENSSSWVINVLAALVVGLMIIIFINIKAEASASDLIEMYQYQRMQESADFLNNIKAGMMFAFSALMIYVGVRVYESR